jgi:hypothetical protein
MTRFVTWMVYRLSTASSSPACYANSATGSKAKLARPTTAICASKFPPPASSPIQTLPSSAKKLEFDPKDKRQQTAINPTIVFEVLSKSTESYDRGKKAENYRQLDSLKAYVLVSQTSPHIEIYERHGDGFWFLTEAKGLDQELSIKSLGLKLPLSEVYDRMKFGKQK